VADAPVLLDAAEVAPKFISRSDVDAGKTGVSGQSGNRKRGRVVDCTGLENRRPARVREFESHRFRQLPVIRVSGPGLFDELRSVRAFVALPYQ
jgi:hypothetical protein